MATTEPGPELGFLPEGFHATPHPRADQTVALVTADPRLSGVQVRVVDWYDRAHGALWKASALAGHPEATQYANRIAILGLSDTPHAVIVEGLGGAFLVHQSEIPPA